MSLLGGYELHDNDRLVVDNLNGFEVAEADFDSFFLSPSVTLSSEFMVFDNIAIRPSATGIYSVAWYESYRETGTTLSNLAIDNRSSHALVGQVKMTVAYLFGQGSEIGLLGGYRYRYTSNGDVDASLAGSSFRYATVGDDDHYETIVGANMRLALSDSLHLTADAEYSFSDGIETTLSGQAGIEFTF